MHFKPLLSLLLVSCVFVSVCAQSSDLPNNSIPTNTSIPPLNITVISGAPVVLYDLIASIVTCPVRDQILRLNQLLAIENANLAFFQQLQARFNNVSITANIGLPIGVDVSALRSNLSTVITQIDDIISFLNSTIVSSCSTLPSDDQDYCYAWAPCNYTFGNLTAFNSNSSSNSSNSSNSTSPTAAPVANHTANSTAGSNSTLHTNASTVSGPSASVVRTALSQGWYMSDQSVNYYISTVLLVSNTTLQLQLMEFESVHAQQSSFFRFLTQQQIISTPVVLSSNSNLNAYSRPNILSQYASFVSSADRQCCEGFRGVSPV